jgi:hypothetical protein
LLGEWAILHEKSLFAKWKLKKVSAECNASAAPTFGLRRWQLMGECGW